LLIALLFEFNARLYLSTYVLTYFVVIPIGFDDDGLFDMRLRLTILLYTFTGLILLSIFIFVNPKPYFFASYDVIVDVLIICSDVAALKNFII